MSLEEQRDHIIEQLKTLNEAVARQNSLVRSFVTGIIWGIGFVIGSGILAVLLLGFLLPFFENVEWVRDLFIKGDAIIH